MTDKDSFLQPLLELMNSNSETMSKRLDDMSKKIDANTVTTNKVLAQAKYTNGRVKGLEKREADRNNTKVAKKFNIDPKTMYIIAICALIVLVIVAKFLNVNIGGIAL